MIGILTKDCLILYLFCQLNDTKRKKQKTAYTGDFAFLLSFFYIAIERNETIYNGSYFYFPFLVYDLGKEKRRLIYLFLFSIMYSENQKRKDDIYSTTCFFVFPFSSRKRKNENIYNGSYFYFSFFVCGLRKKKSKLMYPFSIFYHEIEKRKTKGRYIHGPGTIMFNLHLYIKKDSFESIKPSFSFNQTSARSWPTG